jgi:hypothetical protein
MGPTIERSRTDRRAEAGWQLTLYPAAGEAGGTFHSSREAEPARWTGDGPDASAVAARRARGKVRRYCAANGLNRLGTLTYRGVGCHEPEQLRTDVGAFFRRLRFGVGDAFPYLWVPEWHPGGHGLHVHFAVGRFIGYRLIRDAWGHGFVHIKLLGHLAVGSGMRGEARLAAWYLSKYLAKDLDDVEKRGLHRYEVAQGFQPQSYRLDATSADNALAWADAVMGAKAERVWRSRDEDGWSGPPAVWAQWT